LRAERINRLYTPYHDTLVPAAERSKPWARRAVDCHSMPSNPISDQGGARSGLATATHPCSGERQGRGPALKAQAMWWR
jgi:N-formylglutamate amidohydrolase